MNSNQHNILKFTLEIQFDEKVSAKTSTIKNSIKRFERDLRRQLKKLEDKNYIGIDSTVVTLEDDDS